MEQRSSTVACVLCRMSPIYRLESPLGDETPKSTSLVAEARCGNSSGSWARIDTVASRSEAQRHP